MTKKQAKILDNKSARTEAERKVFAGFEQVLAARVGPQATFAEVEAAGLRFAAELCRQQLEAVRAGK